MAAAKKIPKNPALKTRRTVLKVKLRRDENGKWRGEINGCEVAFKGHNQNAFWCWSALTPFEWGACVGGIRLDSLRDAVKDAQARCEEPPSEEPKKHGKPSKKKALGSAELAEMRAELVEMIGFLDAQNPLD